MACCSTCLAERVDPARLRLKKGACKKNASLTNCWMLLHQQKRPENTHMRAHTRHSTVCSKQNTSTNLMLHGVCHNNRKVGEKRTASHLDSIRWVRIDILPYSYISKSNPNFIPQRFVSFALNFTPCYGVVCQTKPLLTVRLASETSTMSVECT